MCFLCLNNCCRCNRNCCQYCQNYCPRCPQGPVGPQGPAGRILSNSYLITSTAVDSGDTIPLNDGIITTNTITHTTSSPTITLSAGNYLIQYDTTATSDTIGDLAISILQNGTLVSNSTTTAYMSTANTNVVLSNALILTVTDGTTITLQNSGANTTTYGPLNLIITKLGL